MTTEELLATVLKLPLKERAELTDRLLRSLPVDDDVDWRRGRQE
jgi:hypothetical protein